MTEDKTKLLQKLIDEATQPDEGKWAEYITGVVDGDYEARGEWVRTGSRHTERARAVEELKRLGPEAVEAATEAIFAKFKRHGNIENADALVLMGASAVKPLLRYLAAPGGGQADLVKNADSSYYGGHTFRAAVRALGSIGDSRAVKSLQVIYEVAREHEVNQGYHQRDDSLYYSTLDALYKIRLGEEFFRDGELTTVKGRGKNAEVARENANKQVPSNAEVVETWEILSHPYSTKSVTVDGFDENTALAKAAQAAREKFGAKVEIYSFGLVATGKKGFMGIGRKPNQYQARLSVQDTVVGITYKAKAKTSPQ